MPNSEGKGSQASFSRPSSAKSGAISQGSKKEIVCRVCLSGDSEDKTANPLLTPCRCAGTMRLIHFECLKSWLHGKIHTKVTKYTNSFNWKNLECELCKVGYTDSVFHKNREYNLLEFERPEGGHYLVLESVTNTAHKTIHVSNMTRSGRPPPKQALLKIVSWAILLQPVGPWHRGGHPHYRH